jgi:hypothetical protein
MMEKTCLESLNIKGNDGSDIQVEELLALISALKHNAEDSRLSILLEEYLFDQ